MRNAKSRLTHKVTQTLLLIVVLCGQIAFAQSHSVTLAWHASTSSNIAGYNAYRSDTSGGPYTKQNTSLIAGTGYFDGSVVGGQTYYYVATAVTTGNIESVFSSQVTAVVPGTTTAAPAISSFTANPATIASGQSSTLSWVSSNATALSISPTVGDVTGHTFATVTPNATTTYTLTATNSVGSVTRAITVVVAAVGAPVISSFTASPGTITAGSISTLSWVTSGATSLTISPGIGDVTANTGQTARTLGNEPGIQFGNAPSNLCAYGEYQRSPASAFGGSCANFLKLDDIFPMLYNAALSGQSIPLGLVDTYAIKVIWDGGTYNGYNGDSTGLNVADPAFQNYFWGTYVPTVVIPNFQAKTGTTITLTNPLYISGDAWFAVYSTWGADVGGVRQTPVVWAPGYPQNATEWSLGFQAFMTAAKTLAPKIRLSPHIASQDPIVWANFRTIYADCPALEKEHFPLSEPVSDSGHRFQVYNQIQAFYWLANLAPPVFLVATEPQKRITQWGTDINETSSSDIHTALALYEIQKGPNSFFDLLGSGNTPVAPSLWLPMASLLGNPSSATSPQIVRTAAGHQIGDGFNLLSRTYPGGVAYYNMSGSSQTFTPPAGARDSNENPVTSLTLADGRGEVVFVNSTVTGSGGSGSIAVSPPATTQYVLTACNSAGCTTAQTTVTVSGSAGGTGSCTGGSHAYWRVRGTLASNGPTDTGNGLSSSELQFRSVTGGSNVATGGTALASSTFSGDPASNAFDGNNGTFWSSALFAFVPQWLGYHFGSPVNIVEFVWRDRGDGFATWQDPTAGTLDYSDDGSSWTSEGSFSTSYLNWLGTGSSNTFTICGGSPLLPVISSFTANPTTISQGGSSTLSWTVTGATNLSMNQGVGTVTGLTSTVVSPTVDTTYTLTAFNAAGFVTQTVLVHVQTGNVGQVPVITSFTATPSTISPGASSQLAWVVSGASSITIDQAVGNVTNVSSISVAPAQTTTYTLTATNNVGTSSATVTVTVNVAGALPAILSFDAFPRNILLGGSSTLEWITNHDETSLSIDHGVGTVTGLSSFVVSPIVTTTYTLTATNAQGSVTATATVTIVASCTP